MLGVVKAYGTRVGEVPSSRNQDGIAECIREKGNEYGTSTGRPRRIGWFDGVAVSYSRMVSGLTGLAVTLLDVLSGLETVKICTAYELRGKIIHTIHASIMDFEDCKPLYEELPGWMEDISQAKSFSDLPANAQNYIERIEKITGGPVVMISVGPDQTQTIMRKNIF